MSVSHGIFPGQEFENSPLRLCNVRKEKPQSINRSSYFSFSIGGEPGTYPTRPIENALAIAELAIHGIKTYQQPVRDLGGKRMRGGAIRPFSNFPSTGSSLGAIMGSRSGRLAEAWPRRFCITRLVVVIRLIAEAGLVLVVQT